MEPETANGADAADVICTALNWGVVMVDDPAPGTAAEETKSWLIVLRLSSYCAHEVVANNTSPKAIRTPVLRKLINISGRFRLISGDSDPCAEISYRIQ